MGRQCLQSSSEKSTAAIRQRRRRRVEEEVSIVDPDLRVLRELLRHHLIQRICFLKHVS